ncbi:MAG: class I SAM-dependent methyltransferase [bacterium]
MPYTAFDRVVATLRFRAALPHIRRGSRVCDLGCGLQARFLRWLGARIRFGIGVDRQISTSGARAPVLRADITTGLPMKSAQFDHVVMLAVLEHLVDPQVVLREAHRILVPGGSLIMTWPSPVVDLIVDVLHRIGIVSDEMESEEHQDRIPLSRLQDMLKHVGFGQFVHRRFECGFNNLLVAVKSVAGSSRRGDHATDRQQRLGSGLKS